MRIVAFVLTAVVPGYAQTSWIRDPASPGDWFDLVNWSNGVPDPFTLTYLDNGGTAVISSGAAGGSLISVGDTQSGFLQVSGGSITTTNNGIVLGFNPGAYGQLDLSGTAQIIASPNLVVGFQGDGLMNMTGGAVTFTSSFTVGGTGAGANGRVDHSAGAVTATAIGRSMSIGQNAASSGRYDLRESGSIDVWRLTVGGSGSGEFNQNGSSVTVVEDLSIGGTGAGRGVYDAFGNAQIHARRMFVGGAPAGGPGLFPGGTGTFTLRGGLVELTFLTLAGNPQTNGTFNLREGAVTATEISIGHGGAGSFNQFGGSVEVSNSLGLFPRFADAVATYEIRGGALSAKTLRIDSSLGGGEAHFTQRGGHVTADTVDLRQSDGNVASYRMRGGTLTAGSITSTGGAQFIFTGGTLDVDAMEADLMSSGGTLAPGGNAPGELALTGSLQHSTGSLLQIGVGGEDPSSGHDRLAISGAALLAGDLDVQLLGSFVPNFADSFTILTAASITGRFANAPGQLDFSGGHFEVTYTPTSVVLSHFVPEPAGAVSVVGLLCLVAVRRARRPKEGLSRINVRPTS